MQRGPHDRVQSQTVEQGWEAFKRRGDHALRSRVPLDAPSFLTSSVNGGIGPHNLQGTFEHRLLILRNPQPPLQVQGCGLRWVQTEGGSEPHVKLSRLPGHASSACEWVCVPQTVPETLRNVSSPWAGTVHSHFTEGGGTVPLLTTAGLCSQAPVTLPLLPTTPPPGRAGSLPLLLKNKNVLKSQTKQNKTKNVVCP